MNQTRSKPKPAINGIAIGMTIRMTEIPSRMNPATNVIARKNVRVGEVLDLRLKPIDRSFSKRQTPHPSARARCP